MTQEQLDILCVNTQVDIGLQAPIAVDLINGKDRGALSYIAKLSHIYNLSKAIKDFDVNSGDLTDEELFSAQEKIDKLNDQQSKFFLFK